jgi:lipid II:glycine glycyltransferase (peptidoglycan interpeptide bridge formation enzyme)
MITTLKPYFIQTKDWSDFWLESSLDNHFVECISHNTEKIEISTIVYQYPWHLGKSFFYIPKGPVFSILREISNEEILIQYQIFLQKIEKRAREKNMVFVKLDFDYQFTNLFHIEDNKKLLSLIRSKTNSYCTLSSKPIQYLSTMILDCQNLQYLEDLSSFVETNKPFWSKTNENIRRYTRKSLTQNWRIDATKSKENFENFWTIYSFTANRQGFAIHPKKYFEKLINHNFVRIIVLSDEKGVPHCCWFGISLLGTLYYLYGGNDDYSFAHYGQYLVHVVALQIASKENISSYDLGGYDSEKGFGKFKEGYRGKIVTFLGPIDIVLDKTSYTVINRGLQVGHALKSMLRK